jgi:hypothetical protein
MDGQGMSCTRTIVCLAKSWKMHGHCVAGRSFSATAYLDWVRPVSARPTEELSAQDLSYGPSVEASVLDIIEVPLVRAAPHLHQVENHLIDASARWKKVGQATWNQLQAAVQTPAMLWLNGNDSFNGTNDRVAQTALAGLGASLYLIAPENVSVTVGMEGPPERQRQKVRIAFDYSGERYAVGVTDPVAYAEYVSMGDGAHILRSEMIFCVSLGESFMGYAYKLVAGVFTPTRTAVKL